MPTFRIDEPPQRLAEELAGLEHVDWPAIWAGPPYPGPALNDWCALFGWKPLPQDRVLAVRTATGGRLSLQPVIGGLEPGPVSRLDDLAHQGCHRRGERAGTGNGGGSLAQLRSRRPRSARRTGVLGCLGLSHVSRTPEREPLAPLS